MPFTATRRTQRVERSNNPGQHHRSRRRNNKKLPEWMDADSDDLSWSDASYKEQEESEDEHDDDDDNDDEVEDDDDDEEEEEEEEEEEDDDDDDEEHDDDDEEDHTEVVGNRETRQTLHRPRRQCTAKRAVNYNEQKDDSDDDDDDNDNDSEIDNQDATRHTATKTGAKANAVTPETQISVAASNRPRRQHNRTRPTKRRLVIDDSDEDDDDKDDNDNDKDTLNDKNGFNRSTINNTTNNKEVIELLDDTDDEEQTSQAHNYARNQQQRSKKRRRRDDRKRAATRRNDRRRPSAKRTSTKRASARRPSARRPTASLESCYDSESTDYSSNNGASNKRSTTKSKSYKSNKTDTDESDSSIDQKNPRTLRYIYCCPLCYVECYRRLDLNIKSYVTVEDDVNPVDIHEEGCFDGLETSEFQYGPFEVMMCVDPSLKLASAFCFRKLKYLKQHLKQDHAIDPSRDVIKNDIFHRFHMNQADGLVQRYLKKTSTMKGLGYMNQYFGHVQEELNDLYEGISFSRRWRRQLAKDASRCSTEEKAFGERAVTFWSSFSLRGHRIWKALQQAYYRDDNDGHSSSGEELEDDDETEGIEEALNHDLLDRQEDDPATEHAEMLKFVKELKQKHNLADSDSSSDDDDDDGELVNTDSEEEEEEPVTGLWAESSSIHESDSNDYNLEDEQLDTLQADNSLEDDDGDSEHEEILFSPRGRKRKRTSGYAFVDDDDEA